MTICGLLCMASKNVFKYFKCWAWSIKRESEVTPPAPNSSQFNFSPNEKSDSGEKTWETSEMITHYGTRTLWRLYEVRRWQMFTAGSTGVWGSSSARVTQGHKRGTVGSPEKRRGCAQDTQTLIEGALSPQCLLQCRAQAHFELKDDPNAAAQTLPTAPLHLLECSENQLCGSAEFGYFHKKLLHLTISQECSEWNPSVNISMGPTSRSLILADIPHQWDPWQSWVSRLWTATKENHTSAATNI